MKQSEMIMSSWTAAEATGIIDELHRQDAISEEVAVRSRELIRDGEITRGVSLALEEAGLDPERF